MNEPKNAVGKVYRYLNAIYVVLGTKVHRGVSLTLVLWDDGEFHWYLTSSIGSGRDKKL